MRFKMHNYTMTPAIVTQVVNHEDKVTLKRVNVPEKGIYNPVTGSLKVGSKYPTSLDVNFKPVMSVIKEIEEGCLIF